MANYYNLRNVLHEYHPLIRAGQHLLSLHDELLVEIRKEQYIFYSTHQCASPGAFQWKKISPVVRARFNILKKGIDEHCGASLPGI